jgi:hypothetical protein
MTKLRNASELIGDYNSNNHVELERMKTEITALIEQAHSEFKRNAAIERVFKGNTTNAFPVIEAWLNQHGYKLSIGSQYNETYYTVKW